MIAGHEPCGEIVEIGPGVSYFAVGDRVILHHIVGCGRCRECRSGSFITCAAAAPVKNAYGYGRDGGHADFLLAEESTCIRLADELSFVDGACVACGFGTAYEALVRANVSGRDAVLINRSRPCGHGRGPSSQAYGAERVLGVDVGRERIELATSLGSIDFGVVAGGDTVAEILDLTGGRGCEVTVDCSGVAAARQVALESTRQWGRCMLVGEGNRLDIDVSAQLIHRQIAIYGSWVTSLPRMDELVELLVRWNLHPESIVTHRYGLADAGEAYATADAGTGGKVAIVMDA